VRWCRFVVVQIEDAGWSSWPSGSSLSPKLYYGISARWHRIPDDVTQEDFSRREKCSRFAPDGLARWSRRAGLVLVLDDLHADAEPAAMRQRGLNVRELVEKVFVPLVNRP
jgi:hypothetical protein